jgi:p-aminobenzoyl-glutamate transporter AbgT
VNSRWPFYASVAVLGCECIACFFAASFEWGERGARVAIDSAEAAEQARFAIELYAIGAVNLLASIAFLLRRWGWTWWLVLGVQVGVFVLAVIEGVLTDLGWFYFSSLPLLTLFLLFAFRKRQARLKPPVEAI